ncbi:MAG: sulfur carrier protein ThiS [Brevinematales bacterium]|nr:sulfur carrier protein ThiS [Brevinematales bacterium]
MKILVNGEEKTLLSPLSLQKYLEELGISSQRVVVEYNGKILPKEQWGNTLLSEGDTVEIVHFVGGG